MAKILIKLDDKTKKDFKKNCKDYGVSMSEVVVSAIIRFNEQVTSTKQK